MKLPTSARVSDLPLSVPGRSVARTAGGVPDEEPGLAHEGCEIDRIGARSGRRSCSGGRSRWESFRAAMVAARRGARLPMPATSARDEAGAGFPGLRYAERTRSGARGSVLPRRGSWFGCSAPDGCVDYRRALTLTRRRRDLTRAGLSGFPRATSTTPRGAKLPRPRRHEPSARAPRASHMLSVA